MATTELASRIALGQRALESGAWDEARSAFEAALREQPDSPEALEGLGMAAWWLRDPVTVFHREHAYREYRKRNDARSAGRVAITLAEDYRSLRGEMAIARGWNRRARRILDPLPPSAEHGWLRIIEGDFALNDDRDPVLAARLGSEASEIGRDIGDVDVQMLGLALEGMALVSQGRIQAGMPCLDEATAAAVAGEFSDPYAVGACFCYLVSACVLVRDLERATQWCERVEEFARQVGYDMLFFACRVQHAEVLIWQGALDAAERELVDALRQAADHYPAIADHGAARLADLRRIQGQFDEAERLLASITDQRTALLPRARLALDRGDARAAARHAERFLRRIPESNGSERLGALAVLIRACLAAGDERRATELLPGMAALARQLGTAAAMADAAFASGICHLAANQDEPARRELEDAVDLYMRSGMPQEGARARLELARALGHLGERDAAEREIMAGSAALGLLGIPPEPIAAGRVGHDTIPARTRSGVLTRRELDVLQQVAEGRTNAEVAVRLHLSEHTVKRHIANILTKLDLPSRAAAVARAVREGLL